MAYFTRRRLTSNYHIDEKMDELQLSRKVQEEVSKHVEYRSVAEFPVSKAAFPMCIDTVR